MKNQSQQVIDTVIRLIILLLLVAWCFQILFPFVMPVLWAVIIGISVFPLYDFLRKKLGGKSKAASFIFVILALALIIVPSYFLFGSLAEGIIDLTRNISENNITYPPPPAEVADWPLIGQPLFDAWSLFATNIDAAFEKYNEQIVKGAGWFLGSIVDTGLGILQFILSIIIAGVLLVQSDSVADGLTKLSNKIAGERGGEFVQMARKTITNVTKGILGVAVIQSVLLGLAFFISGVPYAGLWAFICLFLAIIQLGPGLVCIGVIIYYYANMEPLPATLWTVLVAVLMVSDNVLKPILLGKGAPVPMLVIFLGAIGGFILSGFIGLFTGAIVLSIGYKLMVAWIYSDDPDTESAENVSG